MALNIVCLDGYTLNPGDLSWDSIQAYGNFIVYDHTPVALLINHAKDADIILTNKVAISCKNMEQLPNLKLISVLATGYNVVDIEAARAQDISVCNVPSYGTASVAQMVFAHILNFTQHVAHHAETVKEGRWGTSSDFCYWDYPLIELDGLTIGIVGFGRTGRATATLAKAFGMQVLAYNGSVKETDSNTTLTDLDTLFSQSDFVSLHLPLTPKSQGIVNAALLSKMKRTAFIINTSRGPIINEADLYAALGDGQIAGAGLDVLQVEPADPENPLVKLDNCVITPHIAWATSAARARLMKVTATNIEAFMNGRPINVVN